MRAGSYGGAECVVVGLTQLYGAVQVEVVGLRHEAKHVEGEARHRTVVAPTPQARARVPVQNGDGVVAHTPGRTETREGTSLLVVMMTLIEKRLMCCQMTLSCAVTPASLTNHTTD